MIKVPAGIRINSIPTEFMSLFSPERIGFGVRESPKRKIRPKKNTLPIFFSIKIIEPLTLFDLKPFYRETLFEGQG